MRSRSDAHHDPAQGLTGHYDPLDPTWATASRVRVPMWSDPAVSRLPMLDRVHRWAHTTGPFLILAIVIAAPFFNFLPQTKSGYGLEKLTKGTMPLVLLALGAIAMLPGLLDRLAVSPPIRRWARGTLPFLLLAAVVGAASGSIDPARLEPIADTVKRGGTMEATGWDALLPDGTIVGGKRHPWMKQGDRWLPVEGDN